MNENEVVDYFPPTRVWNDRMFLYNKNDANQLLEILLRHNIGLLGVEGFRIIGHQIQPDMDFIADCSWSFLNKPQEFVSLSISLVRSVLAEAPEDMFFEFVVQTTMLQSEVRKEFNP